MKPSIQHRYFETDHETFLHETAFHGCKVYPSYIADTTKEEIAALDAAQHKVIVSILAMRDMVRAMEKRIDAIRYPQLEGKVA